MSNKRNRRRPGQRVRSEISRKPVKSTKAQGAFLASLRGERDRKEELRYWRKPTKKERSEREKHYRRRFLGKARKVRKPRTKHGATYYRHSLDN